LVFQDFISYAYSRSPERLIGRLSLSVLDVEFHVPVTDRAS